MRTHEDNRDLNQRSCQNKIPRKPLCLKVQRIASWAFYSLKGLGNPPIILGVRDTDS
ncbi:unnamed protein product [Moneuplotes crassus]|uniref:Uncharacterized protein n=1 Tax=Euplotes crassus TaxID=5936 RepID=A0AAD2D5X9_EUPCR|nr:unnamed protein product [Moneuplotes crassus]